MKTASRQHIEDCENKVELKIPICNFRKLILKNSNGLTPAIGVPSLETISEKLLGRQFSMALKTQL